MLWRCYFGSQALIKSVLSTWWCAHPQSTEEVISQLRMGSTKVMDDSWFCSLNKTLSCKILVTWKINLCLWPALRTQEHWSSVVQVAKVWINIRMDTHMCSREQDVKPPSPIPPWISNPSTQLFDHLTWAHGYHVDKLCHIAWTHTYHCLNIKASWTANRQKLAHMLCTFFPG